MHGEWLTTSTILGGLRHEGDAWDRLVGRFRTPIIAFARRVGVAPADAEDVAQETLLAFAEGFRSGRYDPERGRLSHWLFGIAYRQIQRQLRRDARAEVQVRVDASGTTFWSALPDEPAAKDAWEQEWERAALAECAAVARREFEPETFDAFELSVIGDRSAARVAEMVGVPVKSVYNAKHRVLKRIRELRAQYEDVEPR